MDDIAISVLRIWHGGNRSSDNCVTEIRTLDIGAWLESAKNHSGFWHNDAFVPWHRIYRIEMASEEQVRSEG